MRGSFRPGGNHRLRPEEAVRRRIPGDDRSVEGRTREMCEQEAGGEGIARTRRIERPRDRQRSRGDRPGSGVRDGFGAPLLDDHGTDTGAQQVVAGSERRSLGFVREQDVAPQRDALGDEAIGSEFVDHRHRRRIDAHHRAGRPGHVRRRHRMLRDRPADEAVGREVHDGRVGHPGGIDRAERDRATSIGEETSLAIGDEHDHRTAAAAALHRRFDPLRVHRRDKAIAERVVADAPDEPRASAGRDDRGRNVGRAPSPPTGDRRRDIAADRDRPRRHDHHVFDEITDRHDEAMPVRVGAFGGHGSVVCAGPNARSHPGATVTDVVTDPYGAARAAAEHIARATEVVHHDVAVVLGSGWGPALETLGSTQVTLPMADVPGFPAPRVAGHAGAVRSHSVGSHRVLVLAGRVHLYEGHHVAQVVHAVRTAVATGAGNVVLTNSSGGIYPGYTNGQAVLIADHLNLTAEGPTAGAEPPPAQGSRFVDLSDLYARRLRAAAREVEPGLAEGVYAALRGPHYETPAEIRMLATMGASLVGMSTALEAIAARHLGAEVLGLSLVTNPAAGVVAETALDHAEVLAAGRAAAAGLGALLARIIATL